jgi:hypothetical protein
MKRSKPRWGHTDPQGRLDVFMYRFAERLIDHLEQERGVLGLRENLLPIVEDAILAQVPGGCVLPKEIAALLRISELNRGRGGRTS